MIFDMHAHLPLTAAPGTGGFQWWIPELPQGPLTPRDVAEYLSASPLDGVLGVTPVVSRDDGPLAEAIRVANNRTQRAVDAAPGVMYGSCAVNPHAADASVAEVERCVRDLGFHAVGEVVPHSQNFKLDSPPVRRIIEKAVELDTALLLHSSEPEHYNDIVALARNYPQARIVMAHLGGFRYWRGGVDAVAPVENIRVDISAWCLFCMGALEYAVKHLGADRVLFGTDFPLMDIGSTIWKVRNAGLSAEQQERIFWKNAADIFRLPLR